MNKLASNKKQKSALSVYWKSIKSVLHSRIAMNAIEQQYQYRPKYSGALLPKTDVAVSVALDEKLDTFVGMFGIGQKPTGTQDPFA